MVGRLDKDTSGLLLLTTDGRLVNAVCRASSGCEKTYLVRTRDPVADGELRRLREGVVITTEAKRDGRAKLRTAKTLPCEANRARGTPNAVELTIREGRNRQIRRMFAAVGHEVTGLHRTSVMSISLSGLSPGSWKELSEREVAALRSAMEAAEHTGRENRDTPAREARALSPAEQREAAMSAAGGSPAQLRGGARASAGAGGGVDLPPGKDTVQRRPEGGWEAGRRDEVGARQRMMSPRRWKSMCARPPGPLTCHPRPLGSALPVLFPQRGENAMPGCAAQQQICPLESGAG
eukprot:CAMPEP_0177587040 /NCGR_PEP_ID=MMETSP0419_2-20121207/5415_1 /TAXON_ID=582737 /ORGANISM="Tetraselmis sp., Strain GSL018" /LENGTH=292 /DNA_ID=CAMNT_0019077015 /DNA_START=691 /DNA_END=1570 /DNA_ORIENTATION=+